MLGELQYPILTPAAIAGIPDILRPSLSAQGSTVLGAFIHGICGPTRDAPRVYLPSSIARWDPSPILPPSNRHNFQTYRFHLPSSDFDHLSMKSFGSIVTGLSFFALRQLFPLRYLLPWGLIGANLFSSVSLALASPLPVQGVDEAREITPGLNARQIPPPDYKILQRDGSALADSDILARGNEPSDSSRRGPSNLYMRERSDSFKRELPDSFKRELSDSFKRELSDSFKRALSDSFRRGVCVPSLITCTHLTL